MEIAAPIRLGRTSWKTVDAAHRLGRAGGLHDAANVARRYMARMAKAMKKLHPVTGKENMIARCKHDAARSIYNELRKMK